MDIFSVGSFISKERGKEMKNIIHFSIIAVIVILMSSVRTHATNENYGNPTILENLENHDTDVKTKLDDILAAVQNGGGDCPDAPVEKTGQIIPYWQGDDGELERGVAWPDPRFTDNGDGTITDNLTHLIWDKDADRFGSQTWILALNACNLLAENGVDLTDGSQVGDWSLPNYKEIVSLLHLGVSNPALPDTLGTGKWSDGDPFHNVQTGYWTSTTDHFQNSKAWIVGMQDGSLLTGDKGISGRAWCVRGGP